MISHKFQSISESQWQSGVPRHQCAECSQDYGHPIHCESSLSPLVIIEDCYIPEYTEEIVKLTEASTMEQDYAGIYALAVYAADGLRREKLN